MEEYQAVCFVENICVGVSILAKLLKLPESPCISFSLKISCMHFRGLIFLDFELSQSFIRTKNYTDISILRICFHESCDNGSFSPPCIRFHTEPHEKQLLDGEWGGTPLLSKWQSILSQTQSDEICIRHRWRWLS